MADCQACICPFFFASGDGRADFGLNPLTRVVRIVVIKIRFDVLRVIHVAMITLTVVFPHNLPIGRHVVVHDLGDLCPFQTLRPCHTIDRRCCIFELRRIIRERHIHQTRNLMNRSAQQSQARLIDFRLHATA